MLKLLESPDLESLDIDRMAWWVKTSKVFVITVTVLGIILVLTFGNISLAVYGDTVIFGHH